MSAPELVIRASRVVTPDGVTAAAIHISEGRIVRLGAFDDVPRGCPLVEVGDDTCVMPGLVDTHVHINEPGRTDWEGFAMATRRCDLVWQFLHSLLPKPLIFGRLSKINISL